jgi:hypothetical protein
MLSWEMLRFAAVNPRSIRAPRALTAGDRAIVNVRNDGHNRLSRHSWLGYHSSRLFAGVTAKGLRRQTKSP